MRAFTNSRRAEDVQGFENEEATCSIELQLMAAALWQHTHEFLSAWTAWTSQGAAKCDICSSGCDNRYVSNWRLACHMYFLWVRCPLELAQRLWRVALALHKAGSSTPLGVTLVQRRRFSPHAIAEPA